MTAQNPDQTCDDAATVQEAIVEYETAAAAAAAAAISFGGDEAAVDETDVVDEAQTLAVVVT